MGKINEIIDRRILGALRFIDPSTQQVIRWPLQLQAEGVIFIRNRSGIYGIASAPGLSAHTQAFNRPPFEPALESISIRITITDPRGNYIPHMVTIQLPRDPLSRHSNNADSLFCPIDIKMFHAPSASLWANWSSIRASLSYKTVKKIPAPGALILVKNGSDTHEVLAKGISDKRGEALVVIPGIPITTFSDSNNGSDISPEPVLTFEIPAQVEVIFDPTASWPVDPYELEENSTNLLRITENVLLKTGRMEKLAITIPNN